MTQHPTTSNAHHGVQVLAQERPDIDKKRTNMIKLQGEFRVRLRGLEDKLLFSLNRYHCASSVCWAGDGRGLHVCMWHV